MVNKDKRKLSLIFARLCNYEYWPYAIFYFPVLFYGIYLALRSRSFMCFSTANPDMIYGGVLKNKIPDLHDQIESVIVEESKK